MKVGNRRFMALSNVKGELFGEVSLEITEGDMVLMTVKCVGDDVPAYFFKHEFAQFVNMVRDIAAEVFTSFVPPSSSQETPFAIGQTVYLLPGYHEWFASTYPKYSDMLIDDDALTVAEYRAIREEMHAIVICDERGYDIPVRFLTDTPPAPDSDVDANP